MVITVGRNIGHYVRCPEYKRADFPGGFVRRKYAKRLEESSNIVILRPEVAEVFPNYDGR